MTPEQKADIESLFNILEKHKVSDVMADDITIEMQHNTERVKGVFPGTDKFVQIADWQFKLAAFSQVMVAYNEWRRERMLKNKKLMSLN